MTTQHTKDSVGNLLPTFITEPPENKGIDRYKALSINAFVLACQKALNDGKVVIFNKDEKTAEIRCYRGQRLSVEHISY